MLFSLKDLASKLSPIQGENLHVIKTNAYTLHHFQSLSGLVFVLNTKADVPGMFICILRCSLINDYFYFQYVRVDLFSNLQYIYANIYVEYVTKNPLYKMKMDEPLDCPIFVTKMEEYLFSLPALKL